MIKLRGKTKTDFSGLRRFEKRLKSLVSKQIETGFFDDPHYSGLTTAQLMTIHEFGYNNLPQRNVMLSSSLSFRYDLPKIVKQIYNDVVIRGSNPEIKLKQLGKRYEQTIKFTIDAGTFSNPTVSAEWAKVKGFDSAMIHFGDLQESVRSVVTQSPYSFNVRGI